MSYLECTDLKRTHRHFTLDLSFSMDKGELLCIIGPSGSGKSTLLSLISGIDETESGSIILNGEDITKANIQKRHIGMVFQDFSLFPSMNVEQNIQYGMKDKTAEEKERRTEELLNLVGLQGFGKRRVHELSGGEAQRIALARAIAAEPRLLLLDEPLSALDAPLRKKLRDELKDIHNRTGLTMIYVTHDREEAFAIADRIMVLKSGHIQAIGRSEELYNNPPNLFVATFTGEGSVISIPQHQSDSNNKTAFIRPEDITITPEGTNTTDTTTATSTATTTNNNEIHLNAKVIQTEYTGSSYTVTLDCDGTTLKALSPKRPETETVTITIPTERIKYLD